jgi:hypothetical protein
MTDHFIVLFGLGFVCGFGLGFTFGGLILCGVTDKEEASKAKRKVERAKGFMRNYANN